MTISRDDVRALADGELSGDDALAVEAAVATDRDLAREFAAQKRLRATLASHYGKIADEPVPAEWTAMIAAASPEESAHVIDLAAARARRQSRFTLPAWGVGAAIAASLLVGVMLGKELDRSGEIAQSNGAMVATGDLARGLETQLAANGPDQGGLRILATFKHDRGGFCRVFDRRAIAGIACRDERGSWLIERAQASNDSDHGSYRQAGSAASEILAAAQDMTRSDPLNAQAEFLAVRQHWTGLR